MGAPRILHVIDQTGDGGAQMIVLDLLRSLGGRFAQGVAVLGRSSHFSAAYAEAGAPVYELGGGAGRWNPSSARGLARLIRREGYQLVHSHLLKSVVLGTLAARAAGRPALIHDHVDAHPWALPVSLPSPLVRGAYLAAFRWALHAADRAIVLTPATLEAYWRCYGPDARKAICLPNAIDPERFAPRPGGPAGALRAELGLAPETRLVLMVGRLQPEKDWWTFLETARLVRARSQTPCAFLGAGSGDQEQALREQVRRQGPDNVRFLGYRRDIPALLAQTDVFLLTSQREPFGIVVAEAMAAGLPAVATRSGGPETIVTDGVDGLLADVGDAPALAGHILWLLDNPQAAAEIGRRARDTVQTRYSLAGYAARIADLYGELLGTTTQVAR